MRNWLVTSTASLLLTLPLLAAAETADWSRTIERISSGVVSLKVDVTRSFDTERNTSTQGTGFIVDAEKGLILTNRHVVTPAPVRAKALFLNQEEVPLVPVYRDPVHDFGLFRFDPAALRHIRPVELKLNPGAVGVGTEVRIVGNDAGEQLSILSGTIARLDRRAPNYGFGNYNDFNTYYIQAATGSSGGSSGSPVININGDVVALNAGANQKAATSYFLPLDRVSRAVELIRQNKLVTRGTLQTKFVQVAFDELGRLGLSEAVEAEVRQSYPDQTGMLVVDDVLRGGVAADVLEVGDILLELNGTSLTRFTELEAVLDDSVGEVVRLKLERNGKPIQRDVTVADLHAVTPDEYIRFADGVFNNLSYQQGWHLNKPLSGVYVAAPGFALRTSGIPRRSVIIEMNGQPVNDLDDMEAVLNEMADRERIALRFITLEDPNGPVVRLIRMDRRWYAAERCQRDDATGFWPCRKLVPGPVATRSDPVSTRFVQQDSRVLEKVAASLVLVNFDMPFTVSGINDQHYYGTGLVVDAERGYVVVDRNTVPEAPGDVRLTFAGSVEVDGRVEYIHPLHNLALLSYDPEQIGSTPVRTAQLAAIPQRSGDELLAVGLRADSTLVNQDVQVASVDPTYYPLSGSLRFRETNLETISLVTPPDGIDGVLTDQRGRVVALWSSFAYEVGGETYQENKGMPADLVAEMLEAVRTGEPLRSLETELQHLPLSMARDYGLPPEWVRTLEDHDPQRRQLLAVVRTVAGTATAGRLLPGDLLLTIDEQPVTRFREVELAAQKDSINVVVWRNNEVVSIDIATTELDGSGVRRLVSWAGALLQAPYREMAAQRNIEVDGVYIAFYAFGSPASRSRLGPGSRIIEVDGQPVANLDAFIALIKDRKDQEAVRLTLLSWNNSVQVLSLTLDQFYWPAWEVSYNGGWRRTPLASGDAP